MLRTTRRRSVKLALISTSLALSYFMLRAGTTGLRAQKDEVNVIWDILRLVRDDHLYIVGSYNSGNGYPLIATILLKVTGHGYDVFGLLSPFLGAIVVGIMALTMVSFLSSISTNQSALSYIAIAGPATLLCFGGFSIRLAETTHKKFTFTLVFLSLYLAIKIGIERPRSLRWIGLFIGVTSALSLYNYFWAIVYGVPAILSLFATGMSKVRVLVAGSIPMVIAYALPQYLPTAQLHEEYFTATIASILLGGSPASTSGGDTTSWPLLSVGGIEFSSWLVFASGVFLVATIAAASGVYALLQLRDDPTDPIARFYLVISAWFGFVAVGLVAAGDVATVKRIIVVPGAVGVLYAFYLVGATPSLSDQQRTLVLTCVVTFLLVGSMLAIPRGVLDGGITPYDNYGDDSDVKKLEWWDSYAPEDNCLQTHRSSDLELSQMMWRFDRQRVHAVPYIPYANQVYSNGPGVLSCQSR